MGYNGIITDDNNLDDLPNFGIYHWIGLRDNFNRNPPCLSIYLMVKTMVSG